jgi:hypothetical protein
MQKENIRWNFNDIEFKDKKTEIKKSKLNIFKQTLITSICLSTGQKIEDVSKEVEKRIKNNFIIIN